MILSRPMRDALEELAEASGTSIDDLVESVDAIHDAHPLINEASILEVLKGIST